MKIVFWSPIRGHTKQSSNMMALSMALSMYTKSSVLLFQTQFQSTFLEDALLGEKYTAETREHFYTDIGMDALIRSCKRKRIEEEDIKNCCIQLSLERNLFLLPGSLFEQKDIFLSSLSDALFVALQEMEKYYDFCMIDADSEMNEITSRLMEEADLLVISLEQNVGEIAFSMQKLSKDKMKKAVFVIGEYFPDSFLNLHNLRNRYAVFSKKNLGAVPVNIGYMDAISQGRVCDFFEENVDCELGSVNFYFMKEIRQTLERIFLYRNLDIRIELLED